MKKNNSRKWLFCISFLILLLLCVFTIFDKPLTNSKNEMTITNENGEEYTIQYTVKPGFPDKNTRIEIYHENKKISEFETQYDSRHMPKEIAFLFNAESCSYYFMSSSESDYILESCTDGIGSKLEFRVFRIGKMINLTNSEKEKHLEWSEILHKNISESELIEKFEMCGYDYDAIIKLYNLSS